MRSRWVGALWDCVPRVCGGGGGCAGGGVPLGAVPALSWCGEVSLGGILIIVADAVRQDRTRHVVSTTQTQKGYRRRNAGGIPEGRD